MCDIISIDNFIACTYCGSVELYAVSLFVELYIFRTSWIVFVFNLYSEVTKRANVFT